MLWSKQPHFAVVPHHPPFMKGITVGLAMLNRLVTQLR